MMLITQMGDVRYMDTALVGAAKEYVLHSILCSPGQMSWQLVNTMLKRPKEG